MGHLIVLDCRLKCARSFEFDASNAIHLRIIDGDDAELIPYKGASWSAEDVKSTVEALNNDLSFLEFSTADGRNRRIVPVQTSTGKILGIFKGYYPKSGAIASLFSREDIAS